MFYIFIFIVEILYIIKNRFVFYFSKFNIFIIFRSILYFLFWKYFIFLLFKNNICILLNLRLEENKLEK